MQDKETRDITHLDILGRCMVLCSDAVLNSLVKVDHHFLITLVQHTVFNSSHQNPHTYNNVH